jgi:hypothetical protein
MWRRLPWSAAPLCVTVVLCTVFVSRASASGWSLEPVPPPTVPSGQLAAVSCSSPGACTAVGSSVNSAGSTVALAERWNGRTWAMLPLANPRGALAGGLSAVSCPSRNACTAVGGTLIERWNGRSWAIQRNASPASDLDGVSCWNPRGCVAVGESGAGTPFAERWRGHRWSRQSVPDVGGEEDGFSGVSCTSASACMAVGFDITDSSGDSLTLAESWDGHVWSVQNNPDAGESDQLSAVSCVSPTSCTAVGSFFEGSQRPLVERWNRGNWSFEVTARPAGATDGQLVAVSCPVARACTAVGSFTRGPGQSLALVERSRGTKWSNHSPPHRQALGSFSGVSCPSAAACTAIGPAHSGTELVAERWNGHKRSSRQVIDPLGPLPSVLSGVSCTSATACLAVGYFNATVGGSQLPLSEIWNGTRWTPETAPSPAGATFAQLNAVSCASATECVAVGRIGTASGGPTELIELWSGGSWKVETAPQPANSVLNAVSCPSASSCVAVGTADQQMLTEIWNGLSWTVASAVHPSGAGASNLSAVSCSSPALCTAVGYFQASSGVDNTLAESWNGSSWTIQNTPNAVPSGTDFANDQLNGVSCTSPRACTAVGTVNLDQTLAERWDGSTWTIQATPNPGGVSASVLGSVACASSAACAAIGYVQPNSGGPQPLTESWNGGQWVTETTPDPSGKTLNEIACVGARTCTAVGSFATPANIEQPLAETLS